MRKRRRPSEEEIARLIIGSFLAVFVIAILAVSYGCTGPRPDPIPAGTGYAIPVLAEKFEEAVTAPAKKGGVEEQIETIIIVPPSSKPTVVKVYKRKLTPYQKLLTNEAAHAVQSTNAGVTAEQPKKRLWTRWLVAGVGALLLLLAVAAWVWRKAQNFSPWGAVKAIIKKVL